MGLTRVTDIKRLCISDLCESMIAFNPDVKKMKINCNRGVATISQRAGYSVSR